MCNLKTRKKKWLVFSVDRSFSRLSARDVVVSRELESKYRIGPNSVTSQATASLHPHHIQPVSPPSLCCIYASRHILAHTMRTYMYMYSTHIRMYDTYTCPDPSCPIIPPPYPAILFPPTKGSRRLLCDYLKTYFFYNDNDNNDNKLMRSEETFY